VVYDAFPCRIGRSPELSCLVVGPDKRWRLIVLKFPQPLGTLMLIVRVLCFLSSLLTTPFRSRLSLQLEIVALRHQLSVY
jgi:hypothetical protein